MRFERKFDRKFERRTPELRLKLEGWRSRFVLLVAIGGFVVRTSGNHGIRQIGDSCFKFLVRDRVVSRMQGRFAPGKRGFAGRYRGLTALHFAFGDVVRILRE